MATFNSSNPIKVVGGGASSVGSGSATAPSGGYMIATVVLQGDGVTAASVSVGGVGALGGHVILLGESFNQVFYVAGGQSISTSFAGTGSISYVTFSNNF